MADCLFCKIANKELDATIVTETDEVIAFKDINPAAPVHILFVPKRHVDSAQDLTRAEGDLVAQIFETIARVASDEGLEGGHRIVTNVGSDAGQSVRHLHFHLLGGRGFSWPPG